jgi:hypothetical protein
MLSYKMQAIFEKFQMFLIIPGITANGLVCQEGQESANRRVGRNMPKNGIENFSYMGLDKIWELV